MKILSNFFGFSLEAGGYVIGWLNILVSFAANIFCTSILSILTVSIESSKASATVRDLILHSVNVVWLDDEEVLIENIEATTFTLSLTTIFLALLIFFSIYLFTSVIFVLSLQTRSHVRMLPMMVLMIVKISILFAFGLPFSIILGLFYIYFFLCIWSLYMQVKKEKI